jgi:hypothetical protein
MNLVYNIKITDAPLEPHRDTPTSPYDRRNLRQDSPYDVFRYSLSSDAAIPIWNKVMFFVTLDGRYKAQQDELEQYIRAEFHHVPDLHIEWKRKDTQKGWQEMYEHFNHQLLWLQQNHDVVHLDNDLEYLRHLLGILETNENAIITYSSWCETLTHIQKYHPTYGEGGKSGFIAIFATTKELYRKTWFEMKLKDSTWCPRTDIAVDPNYQIPPHMEIIPYKELCRHFDAYAHAHISSEICPALEIPEGFFENNIRIRYGFNNRVPGCTHFNPLASSYKTADPIHGTDYKWLLQDIPLFWTKKISSVEYNPHFDEEMAIEHRLRVVDQLCHRNMTVAPMSRQLYRKIY